MTLNSWLMLAVIASFVASAVLDWRHRRWFEKSRASWLASNGELLAKLAERTALDAANNEAWAKTRAHVLECTERVETAAAKVPVIIRNPRTEAS
jgi:hypothetical protein